MVGVAGAGGRGERASGVDFRVFYHHCVQRFTCSSGVLFGYIGVLVFLARFSDAGLLLPSPSPHHPVAGLNGYSPFLLSGFVPRVGRLGRAGEGCAVSEATLPELLV